MFDRSERHSGSRRTSGTTGKRARTGGALGLALAAVMAAAPFAQAPASPRLQPYDGTMVAALDEATAAAELLLRARLTEIPEARAAFVGEAASRAAESERLQRSALDAYSVALPLVVG